jgi:hypothetical protein
MTAYARATLAIGAFGLFFTAGLFAYELFGIKKCHYLIVAGKRLDGSRELPRQTGIASTEPR